MSNAEKYALKELSKSTDDVLKHSMLLFGARWYSGYHRASIKAELNALIGSLRGSYFKRDTGSRYGVRSNNARALILYESEVRSTLAGKSQEYAKSLAFAMSPPQWPKLGLECGALVMLYYSVLSPFHTVVSATGPWMVVRSAISECQTQLESLASIDSRPFDLFGSYVENDLRKETTGVESFLSEKTKKAWTKIEALHKTASRYCMN